MSTMGIGIKSQLYHLRHGVKGKAALRLYNRY